MNVRPEPDELVDWGSSETFCDGSPLGAVARTVTGVLLAVMVGLLIAAGALGAAS